MTQAIVAIALLFAANGKLVDGVVMGASSTMDNCAQGVTMQMRAAATATLKAAPEGSVLKGYCYDPNTNKMYEEVTFGSVKAIAP